MSAPALYRIDVQRMRYTRAAGLPGDACFRVTATRDGVVVGLPGYTSKYYGLGAVIRIVRARVRDSIRSLHEQPQQCGPRELAVHRELNATRPNPVVMVAALLYTAGRMSEDDYMAGHCHAKAEDAAMLIADRETRARALDLIQAVKKARYGINVIKEWQRNIAEAVPQDINF